LRPGTNYLLCGLGSGNLPSRMQPSDLPIDAWRPSSHNPNVPRSFHTGDSLDRGAVALIVPVIDNRKQAPWRRCCESEQSLGVTPFTMAQYQNDFFPGDEDRETSLGSPILTEPEIRRNSRTLSSQLLKWTF
jgi:hypothetical protein